LFLHSGRHLPSKLALRHLLGQLGGGGVVIGVHGGHAGLLVHSYSHRPFLINCSQREGHVGTSQTGHSGILHSGFRLYDWQPSLASRARRHWDGHVGGGGVHGGHMGMLHSRLHFPAKLSLRHLREHVVVGVGGGSVLHSSLLGFHLQSPWLLGGGGGGLHRGHTEMLHSGLHTPLTLSLLH